MRNWLVSGMVVFCFCAAASAQKDRGALASVEPSAKMPADMTWDFPTMYSQTLPLSWRADGKIVLASVSEPDKELSELNETVSVSLRKGVKLKIGDTLSVIRRGDYIRDEKGKKTGQSIQVSAYVLVTKVKGSKAEAVIVKVINAVEKGDLVKKEKETTADKNSAPGKADDSDMGLGIGF